MIMSFLWMLVPLAVVAGYMVYDVMRTVPQSNDDFVFC